MDPGGDRVDAGDMTASVPFFDVVLRQRATREFTDQPVADELVGLCLRAATHAPSAENKQPWVFVVVRDAGLRASIGDLTRRAWHQGGRQHSEGRLPAPLLREVDRGAEVGIGSAPVIVVVCGDTSLGMEVTLPSSVYPATQNLLLSATALGLGSAMTTLATLFADELRELLDLPVSARPMAVVPLGWPSRPLGVPRRRPLEERAHRDRYGHPW
ncbi:MAG TPA: nitroreductase family protein [Acidimicrobiales bacterium]|jgi:nitroreductase|nr:nitroreductase family protein [Acidimicrobiales bacterium]